MSAASPLSHYHRPILPIQSLLTSSLAFSEPHLELARSQWVLVLHDRLTMLNESLQHTTDDMEYGGAGAQALDLGPLEEAVDEARRMVCALGGEMRRRSEGELPVWKKPEAAAPALSVRTASAVV